MSLTGYKRLDGRWGFRNHVLILPLHQMLSAAARDVEKDSKGAVAVSHDWSQVVEKRSPKNYSLTSRERDQPKYLRNYLLAPRNSSRG